MNKNIACTDFLLSVQAIFLISLILYILLQFLGTIPGLRLKSSQRAGFFICSADCSFGCIMTNYFVSSIFLYFQICIDITYYILYNI